MGCVYKLFNLCARSVAVMKQWTSKKKNALHKCILKGKKRERERILLEEHDCGYFRLPDLTHRF
jgi:hypothetical protein